MNRKSYWSLPALIISTLIFSTLTFLTSCSSSSSSSTPPAQVVTIAATSGGGQSAPVGMPFTNPLTATVSTNGTPTSGVSVTFTSPAATDGTFAGAALTATATTNSSGVATSPTFTAGTAAGNYAVTASVTGATTPASFNLTNVAGVAADLKISSGNDQKVAVNGAYASLVAQVTDIDGNGISGFHVTFTVTPGAMGASGSFTGGGSAEGVITDANGNATVSDLTANGIAGVFTVAAATMAPLTPPQVTFTETNTAVVTGSNTYVFYLSGEEGLNGGPNYYAVAGAVTIDSGGSVTGGEQDYNDAIGNTSLGEPDTPDSISGGTLAVDATTGQGTLTLITNNPRVGATGTGTGTETLGVQFVNSNHALIMQFDGSATSSGSMDLQTLTSASGNFAFTISGVDHLYEPVAFGGVYTAGSGSVTGTIDVNDDGTVMTGTVFHGVVGGRTHSVAP